VRAFGLGPFTQLHSQQSRIEKNTVLTQHLENITFFFVPLLEPEPEPVHRSSGHPQKAKNNNNFILWGAASPNSATGISRDLFEI
jgi:hypothetical protein